MYSRSVLENPEYNVANLSTGFKLRTKIFSRVSEKPTIFKTTWAPPILKQNRTFPARHIIEYFFSFSPCYLIFLGWSFSLADWLPMVAARQPNGLGY